MKIYFAGSIRGGRKDKKIYLQITKYLQKFGKVLTEHVGDQKLISYGEVILSDKEIFERDISWLKDSNVVIAEVTSPSLGVGYELAMAEKLGKKVLCLYRPQEKKRLSAMIAGNKRFRIVKYHRLSQALEKIDNFFTSLGGGG